MWITIIISVMAAAAAIGWGLVRSYLQAYRQVTRTSTAELYEHIRRLGGEQAVRAAEEAVQRRLKRLESAERGGR